MQSHSVTVVYMAGKDMDCFGDPDAALAEALSEFVHILWVDPPSPASTRAGVAPHDLRRVSSSVTRVRASGRDLDRAVSAALDELGVGSAAAILSDPTGRFPRCVTGHRVFYMTEDWIYGARKYGLDRRSVRRSIEANCARADTVVAVSHTLAMRVHLYTKSIDAVRVVPPGCTSRPSSSLDDRKPGSSAALIGALDERLDFDILDAVADAGHDILVAGSRTSRTPRATIERLDAFLARPNVHWVGAHPERALSEGVPRPSVGIVPWVVDALGRARFPAQVFDYLSVGLPVVSTDIPAVRTVDPDHVAIARSPVEFNRRVTEYVRLQLDSDPPIDLAPTSKSESWAARATTMLRLAGLYRAIESKTEGAQDISARYRR